MKKNFLRKIFGLDDKIVLVVGGGGELGKSDKLPKKMTIPAKVGGRVGRVALLFDSTLEKYYQLRGWNKKGHPTKETLKNLGLEEYIDYIV